MKRLAKRLSVLIALLVGGALAALAPHPIVDREKEPSPDRRLPPWGAAVLGLAALAAAVIAGSEYLQSRAEVAMAAQIIAGGDPSRAPPLFARYGCAGCHTIPGIPGADGKVGPPLQGLFERVYIGGGAENATDNLIGWITNPPEFSPHTAMPPTGISAAEARDIAAYLYAH